MRKAKNLVLLFSAFSLSLSAGLVTTALPGLDVENQANAQGRVVEERPERSSAPQMTPEAFAIFEQIQLEIDVENYFAAKDLVAKLLSRKGLSDFEMAMGLQMRGFIAYQEEDINEAIRLYRQILTLQDVPYANLDSIRYQLAQFLANEGQFQEALNELAEWFRYQPNPTPQQFFFKAQLHYQYGIELDKGSTITDRAREQFNLGIRDVETTISLAEADPLVDVLENWYQIYSALYFQLKDYAKVRDVLEIMLVQWPRPAYWVQLSAMYSELQQFDRQLAVLDVAYRLGFLEKEANIVTIAQLYSINGVPYLAAKVVEDNMQTRMVDGEEVSLVNPDDEKNLTLLGQSYLVAREYEKSTGPLNRAASLANDGNLYIQLGSVYSTLEDWQNAAASMQRAIDKDREAEEDDKLEDLSQAYLYLGLAYINFRDFTKAEEAFRNARRVADSEDRRIGRTVEGWLTYITSEKQRLQRLAAAGITPGD